eukprot:SAG11_NODE_7016_length_1207_cov_4.184116_1_plen_98_part_00
MKIEELAAMTAKVQVSFKKEMDALRDTVKVEQSAAGAGGSAAAAAAADDRQVSMETAISRMNERIEKAEHRLASELSELAETVHHHTEQMEEHWPVE